MAKKPSLLESGQKLFPVADNPLDVLNEVHRVTHPMSKPVLEETPPEEIPQDPKPKETSEMRASQKPNTASKQVASAPQRAPKREIKVVNLRLYTDQIAQLRRQAVERSIERNEGKPDMSEIVREILDSVYSEDSH